MTSYRMKYKIGATQYHIPVVDDMAGFGSGIPLGTILPYSANTLNPPEGFLFCDGSAISRAMYPDLFALIGTLYGSGDGSTTFNLPDFTGKFPEGDLTAGTSKSAGLPNIVGTLGSVGGGYGFGPTASGAFSLPGTSISMKITAGSHGGAADINFNASDNNPIYGNSTTVQPASITVRYIIKAFSATSSNSELIDITQYASALNQKLTENDIYGNNFTIVYPNNGTESSPANVTKNSRYAMSNPFPGYAVKCVAEVYNNNQWGETGWIYEGGSCGVSVFPLNDDTIIVQTATTNLLTTSPHDGNPFNITANVVGPLPCRVKVWKIGKLPTQST